VTKDSAEVIELAWILLDAQNLEEVGRPVHLLFWTLKQASDPYFNFAVPRTFLTLSSITVTPPERACEACQHSDYTALQ
jgi:hypothetical protein